MNWLVISIVLQVMLTAYLQVGEWVSLFPWNDLSHGNGQEATDVAMAAIQLVLLFGFIRRIPWLMGLGVGFYAVWMILQIQSWWVPYLFGASDAHMKFHQRWFGKTFTFLPTFGDHPAPDALHTLMHVLILFVVLSSIVAFVQARNFRKEANRG